MAAVNRPRYRKRTWLREHLPERFSRLFPPGERDCGAHEWFRDDEETDRCWHCSVGVRPHQPMPIDLDSEAWQALREAASEGDPVSRRLVLRMMAEHEAYEATVARNMEETAAKLNLDTSVFVLLARSAEDTSRSLAAAAD